MSYLKTYNNYFSARPLRSIKKRELLQAAIPFFILLENSRRLRQQQAKEQKINGLISSTKYSKIK